MLARMVIWGKICLGLDLDRNSQHLWSVNMPGTILSGFSDLILKTTLGSGNYYHPHCTNGKAKHKVKHMSSRSYTGNK